MCAQYGDEIVSPIALHKINMQQWVSKDVARARGGFVQAMDNGIQEILKVILAEKGSISRVILQFSRVVNVYFSF